MTPGMDLDVDPMEALQAASEIAASQGAGVPVGDLLAFGGNPAMDSAAKEESLGTHEDQPQPGTSEAEEVPLDEDAKKDLALELADKLTRYDAAMAGVRERWAEIEDAYHLRTPAPAYRDSDGESIVSPGLMTMVDQAEARLEGGILEAEPLVRVRPIQGISQAQIGLEEDAAAAERFYNNYLGTNVRLSRKIIPALRRTPKLGTSVLRWRWKDETRTHRFYSPGGQLQAKEVRTSGLDFDLVDNEQAIVYPFDLVDWQEAEIVGHRAYYTKAGWRRKAAELGLSEEQRDRVLGLEDRPPSALDREERIDRQGADLGMTEADDPPVCLTELWCNMVLPGYEDPQRFVVLLHEGTPEIFRITWNTHHSQRHPYQPLRWKIVDRWAWGHGIGHEYIVNQQIASALKTMKLDNIKAGAYWVNLVKMGSLAHQITDAIRPGEKIPVSQVAGPDRDFDSVKMGGDAPEIDAAEAQNEYEGRTAVGLPDVLQGVGDARLKSGASTGQTLALIEQASVKGNATGRTVKDDFGEFLRSGFELLCQYAPNGIITRYSDEADGLIVKSLRWTPVRGTSIAEAFEIWIEAPSMATSNESRKERGLILSGFVDQKLAMLQELALQLLGNENPAAIPRYLRSIYEFSEELSRRIIRYHDLPGVEQRFPSLPEPIPEDQVINQLSTENSELQMAVQQLQATVQQLEINIQQGLHHQQQPQGMPS